jgi:predicted DNA-binding ribbon-helix-helix protein
MLVNRNITIDGRRTSIRLEPAMWDALADICRREGTTRAAVCSGICVHKQEETTLTAALRVFIMAYFRAAATEEGHLKAGHAAKRTTDPTPGLVRHALHSEADGPCPHPPPLSMKKLNPLLDMLDEETGYKLLGALVKFDEIPRQLTTRQLDTLLDMLDEDTGRKLLGALATLDALPPGKAPPLH